MLRTGPYRFYIYSHEPNEPPHVHVDRDDATAKFWLHDVSVARSAGFPASELGALRRLVVVHRASFMEAWNAVFGAG